MTKETVGIYSKQETSSPGFLKSLSRTKPIEQSLAEETTTKTLRWYDLTAYGIAATVGSGIYVTVGSVARNDAGPAVIFSTLIAGILSILTGICYLEFASALPISGSGYAYFYALLGEFLGWFIGWNLTLEYGFCAAVISEGWTKYFVALMKSLGANLPEWTYNIVPFSAFPVYRINMIAGIIILLLGFIVSRGARFGTIFTNVITITNISIIVFIIVAGSFYVSPANWSPFMPSVSGVFSGGGKMFFSFIGYDTVSTLAAEAINPSRDIPIAIGLTVGAATFLYICVGLVITGMVPYLSLDERNPLTEAFNAVNAPNAYYVIAVAALLMMAATMFACLTGQPKIFQAIARDGLLPKVFASENRHGTPMFSVTVSTLLLAFVATTIDTDSEFADMIVFGTLLAMSMLCAGVIVVRFKNFEVGKRIGIASTIIFLCGSLASSLLYHVTSLWIAASVASVLMLLPLLTLSFYFIKYPSKLASKSTAFSCPLMPLIPCMAMTSNSYVMMSLPNMSTILSQFGVWTAIGLIIYFAYGIWNSNLRHASKA